MCLNKICSSVIVLKGKGGKLAGDRKFEKKSKGYEEHALFNRFMVVSPPPYPYPPPPIGPSAASRNVGPNVAPLSLLTLMTGSRTPPVLVAFSPAVSHHDT